MAVLVSGRAQGQPYFADPMDVRLDRGFIVQPDVIFVRPGSPAENPDDQRVTGAWAMVVETLSSNRCALFEPQRRIYEQDGVSKYKIVGPDRKSVTSFTRWELGLESYRSSSGELASWAVPGFVPDLDTLFLTITESVRRRQPWARYGSNSKAMMFILMI